MDASARAAGGQSDRTSIPSFARPFAPLVAQLIAGVLGLPQTRARRRAEPTHAARVYGRAPTGARQGALYEAKV